MSDTVQIVQALCSFLTAFVVAYLAYRSSKNTGHLERIEEHTNGLTRALIKSSEKVAHAAGVTEGEAGRGPVLHLPDPNPPKLPPPPVDTWPS